MPPNPERDTRAQGAHAQLGAEIRQLRRSRGLTLQRVADRVPCSIGYLSDVETGKRLPSLDMLHAIALVLGSTAAELLADVDGYSPSPESPASD